MVTSIRFEFGVVMWLHCWVLVAGNGCEKQGDIELYDIHHPSNYSCWPAPECYEGQGSTVEPGSRHPYGTTVECRPCDDGSFSNGATNNRCRKCKTCGKMKVTSKCTERKDTVCSTSLCRSKTLYFNKTDGQCHLCSECCGTDSANIQPRCLLSFPRVGLVIGQKGAFHCKAVSFQRCDDQHVLTSNVSSCLNNASVVNIDNTLENNSSEPENVTGSSTVCTNSNISTSTSNQLEHRSLDLRYIVLMCVCISEGLVIFLLLCLLCKRERKTRLRNGCSSPSYPPLIFRGILTVPFQERLSIIPEDLRIDNISYEVENFIKKLDPKRAGVKNWYDVSRSLEDVIGRDALDDLRTYQNIEGASPTLALLSKLSTCENVITLRRFVQILHDVKRDDICDLIFKFYMNLQQETAV